VVDDGREMFGNYTRLQSGARAKNGFEALEELDSNGDKLIDIRDAAYSSLQLWFDFNPRDGITQPGELLTLSEAGVVSISVEYRTSRHTDPAGNVFRYWSQIKLASGATRKAFDVYPKSLTVVGAPSCRGVVPAR
jgi:hypothetical protein